MTPTSGSSPFTRICVAGLATLVIACSTASAGGPPPSNSRSVTAAAATSTANQSSAAPSIPTIAASPSHEHTTAPESAAATTAAATAAAATTPAVTATAAAPVSAAPTVAPTPQLQTAAPTPAPVAAGPIGVSLTDIAIKLDRSSTAAGSVTFSVKNVGTVIHQLVVLKTDIPQNQIPASSSQPGTMTEPGFIAQTSTLNPGGATTLTLTLASGNYVLMCNQPAHYLVGMHVGFVVN